MPHDWHLCLNTSLLTDFRHHDYIFDLYMDWWDHHIFRNGTFKTGMNQRMVELHRSAEVEGAEAESFSLSPVSHPSWATTFQDCCCLDCGIYWSVYAKTLKYVFGSREDKSSAGPRNAEGYTRCSKDESQEPALERLIPTHFITWHDTIFRALLQW